MKKSQGFTLIELMIVVAIIGILAAIAFPAYQNYIKRTYVTEGIALVMGLKADLTTYLGTRGQWPNNLQNEGLIKNLNSRAVESVTGETLPSNNFRIKIQYRPDLVVAGKSSFLYLDTDIQAKNASFQWKCYLGENMLEKYVPQNCRNQAPE